jgi:hypothetical protein
MLRPTPSPPAHVGHARWHEWGEPALARARAEGTPVLLWIRCARSHCGCVARFQLMNRPALNALIGERFVGVAVDADARPDVVETCRRLGDATGRPGGPVAVVLTPGGHPFHVVTADAVIRDPDRAAALLERVADDFADRPRELAMQAAGLVTLLGLVARIASPTLGIDAALLDRATGGLPSRSSGRALRGRPGARLPGGSRRGRGGRSRSAIRRLPAVRRDCAAHSAPPPCLARYGRPALLACRPGRCGAARPRVAGGRRGELARTRGREPRRRRA